MASQREYQMLFSLNAKMNSQYRSTFQQASAAVKQFQDEYRTLSQTANDITGYQKQQTAVENTKQKLALLQQQYDNIQKEMQETGSYSSDLENKLLSKKAQIEKTSSALQEQIQKLEAYKQKLEAAGVDTSKLDSELSRLKGELDQTRGKMEDAGDAAGKFGEKGAEAAEALGAALAAAGIAKAVHEIYEAFAECVSIAGDFEATISTVEALSGASASEVEALSEEAKRLGSTTVFTAQQSAEAMTYMGMAGWDAQEMIAGMPGVLNLAAASGEDLAMVSDIVTDNLTAFGLSAKDTARFADVLAAAATNSNTDVATMGETFKQSAAVAGALGYSVEDVAVAMGLMANNGIKGSIAGTAMKNMFNGLLDGVTLTSKAFGEYEFSALNADGTMKSFSDTIQELRGWFNKMTEAEKVNNAMTIASKRGYNGLLAILNSTDADYQSLADSINNSTGAAQKMADIKLNNMNGQLTLAKSAWEGLSIAVGEQFTESLSGVYKLAAGVFSGLTKFIQKHPAVVKAIAAITAGVGVFVAVLTGYIAVAKLAAVVSKELVASAAAVAGPVALIAGLAVAFGALLVESAKLRDDSRDLSATAQIHQQEVAELNKEYKEACELYGDTSYQAQELKQKINELNSSYGDGVQTIGEYRDQQAEARKAYEEYISSTDAATHSARTEGDGILSLVTRLEALSTQSVITAADQQEILTIMNALNSAIPDLNLSYDDLINNTGKTIDAVKTLAKAEADRRKYEANSENLISSYTQLDTEQAALAEAIKQRDAQQKINDDLKAKYEELKANEPDWAARYNDRRTQMKHQAEYYDGIQAQMSEAATVLAGYENDVNNHEENIRVINDRINQYASEMADVAEETGNAVDSATSPNMANAEQVNLLLTEYTEKVTELSEAYTEAYDSAYKSISGQYTLFDQAEKVHARSVGKATERLEKQKEYWEHYNENLQILLSYSDDIDGLDQMIGSFADGSKDSVDMIAGMANAVKEGDTSKVKDMVEAWQETKAAQDEAASSIAELSTGYTTEMDELTAQMQEDLEAMNMSDDAMQAGRDTIQGFIDGANSKLGAVQSAYANLRSAALSSLSGTTSTRVPPRNYVMQGFADGTDYAPPGMAWVGERGPELMRFYGGEAVYTASKSAQIMRAYQSNVTASMAVPARAGGSTIQFSPVYNISGGGNAEELRAVLAEHDARFADQLQTMLTDQERDRARRAYS